MSLKEIKTAIQQLPPAELSELARWFGEYHARMWDRQIEEDLRAGKLDKRADKARAEYASVRCKPL